jgi:hypothetical protein
MGHTLEVLDGHRDCCGDLNICGGAAACIRLAKLAYITISTDFLFLDVSTNDGRSRGRAKVNRFPCPFVTTYATFPQTGTGHEDVRVVCR